MKYETLSFLLVLAALSLSSTYAQTQISCAIMDNYWNVYDVSNGYYNTTDSYGIISSNLCLDMEKSCAHTSNEPCSVCQFVDPGKPSQHSYCLGYSKNEQYILLDSNIYPNLKGFRAKLTGDTTYCPGGQQRIVNIDVLCNQPYNYLNFTSESPTCTYNLILYLSSNCQPTANSFTPTFSLLSLTPNSMAFSIDSGYPWMYFTYNVKLNGLIAYQGSVDNLVYINNLDPGTTYTVVVERQSGDGAVLQLTAPSITRSITTLPSNIGNQNVANVSGTGTGIVIGMFIAFLIVGVIFGFLKLRNTDWWADKFGGKAGGGGRKGFSLMDAEKSAAFDS